MIEDKTAEERKQHREKTTVARDAASTETVQYMNTLRDRIEDPAAAELAAMLHAQVNGDHPDYERPPKQEPFGHWHADLAAAEPSVVETTTDTATVEVSLNNIEFVDGAASTHARIIEQTDSLDRQVVETTPTPIEDTTTAAEITTDGLKPDTEYTVQTIAEATADVRTLTDYSDRVSFTTDTL